MRHYLLSLSICLGWAMSSWAEERYCLYWPVYVEGNETLYIAALIDTSDPDPCAEAELVYYWGFTNDPSVPEDCPDCGHMVYLRSEELSATEQSKPRDPFAGLQHRISSQREFADLVPQKWQRHDAKSGGDYTWNPREGIICQHSRIVTVKTEQGANIQVKLFDIKFSPSRASLLQNSIPSKTMKLGFEVTGAAETASTAYEPKKTPRIVSSKQGSIRVDGADYTIISKTPLFREKSRPAGLQND